MFHKKLISLALIATISLSFSACGGSSSGNSGSGGSGNSSSGTGSIPDPIVAYTCEASMSLNGQTIISKEGTEGSLVCRVQNVGIGSLVETSFVDGVNEITATQMIIEEYFNDSSNSTTFNLKEGTEHIVGTSNNHSSVDCVNTYDIKPPITFYSGDEIGDFNIDKYQRIATTCPDWVNDDSGNNSGNATTSNSTYLGNFTVTQDSGAVTKMSIWARTE